MFSLKTNFLALHLQIPSSLPSLVKRSLTLNGAKMIVNAGLLLLISILNLIQINVRCSNLVQIDKLHLITPKMTLSRDSQRKQHIYLDHSQQPSFSTVDYRTAEERPVDQVASIQYELKIVQQKPFSAAPLASQPASEQTEDTNKVLEVNSGESRTSDHRSRVKHSSKSGGGDGKNENRNDANPSDDNSEDKQSPQQSKVNQASAILQHYSPEELVQPKSAKQLENHSFLIHHSYPRNAFSNYAQPTNHDRFPEYGSIPEVKKIVHVHHYHHEHVGAHGPQMNKALEKEQEKKTEKLVEKQVQEAVLKSFEDELERDREREVKRRKKKKAINKKISLFAEDQPWKPVKYSELISKNGRRKGGHSDSDHRPAFEEEEDDFKSYSHQHNSKVARKRAKENQHHKYADDEPDSGHRRRKSAKKSGYRKERPGRERNGDGDAENGTNLHDESFLSRPLSKEEQDFHKSQLENTEDYAFENDEHFVQEDSKLNKQSKLSDEESKEVRKLLNKRRRLKDKKEPTDNEKLYNDKPVNEQVYSDRPPNERPLNEKLFQPTERPELLFDRARSNQKTRRKRPSYESQPVIELLNSDVSKRNSQLRRNWLGLELVTSNH